MPILQDVSGVDRLWTVGFYKNQQSTIGLLHHEAIYESSVYKGSPKQMNKKLHFLYTSKRVKVRYNFKICIHIWTMQSVAFQVEY